MVARACKPAVRFAGSTRETTHWMQETFALFDPVDLLNFFAELLRRGADHVAAFLVGLVAGFVMLYWVCLLFASRRAAALQKRISWFEQDNTVLRQRQGDLSQRAEELARENERLQREKDQADARVAVLDQQLRKALAEVERNRPRIGELEEENRTLKQQLDQQENEAANTRDELRLVREELETVGRQIEALANSDGRLWQRPCSGRVAEFQPLSRRQTPIVAVANFKGGVGKTTITANVGAALAAMGHRVLLIDLDYQGSLTQICVDGEREKDLRQSGRMVSRLFDRPPRWETLQEIVERIPNTRLYLAAAWEDLIDVEHRAMARWLVEQSDYDVRHVLRTVLHTGPLSSRFDIVLLDCPPRLTTACINALAACDSVLIPVVPDALSADAIPRLLTWLRKLRDLWRVQPQLDILGIVVNKAFPRGDKLLVREQRVLDDLPPKCEDSWKMPVHIFRTVIRSRVQFAEAASKRCFAALQPGLEPVFKDLIAELKQRIRINEGS